MREWGREQMNLDADTAGQVTRVLASLKSGEADSVNDLLPLVYEELRRMATAQMARERPGQTLQATALVHEAWLRLAASEQRNWASRSYFFAAAAEAMRRILVENARRKGRLKRGGNWARVELEGMDLAAVQPDDQILLVNEALEELAKLDPVRAEVVKLHFFAGLSHAESGALLGISERTVKRHWSFAKVWLYQRIADGQER